ncbi:hypothetical protein AYR56_10120 [Loigolactobacillus backii]|uniref:Beta-1,6-galactofuranosyltransferase n=1 Tax=Loigolactobacillus backii TaxID=375175 RepID=A0A192H2K7_9LACO|nr:hypothetical protein AYR53_06880 [Loigolactobacillus backii]ANK70477.1 hypothetical protein AYR56_10120 [Loigolactobacillus backii]
MSKAKEDVTFFLKQEQYLKISLNIFRHRYEKIFTKHIINSKFKDVKRNDVLVVQYPTYLGAYFENNLNQILQSRGVKIIGLIHDLDTLRYPLADATQQSIKFRNEIDRLNKYNIVIASNDVMKDFLIANGLTAEVITLGIFDYRHNIDLKSYPKKSNVLNFAGNLNKSQFLYSFSENIETKLKLFGNYDHTRKLPVHADYQGVFKPEELIKELNQGYGLVWDGLSAHRIEGPFGDYLRYNNPHKTSLYLSSGLPVVIWKEAALADFIKENHVGILIASLDDVDKELGKVSDAEYQIMAKNSYNIALKLKKGFYIKSAVKDAVHLLEN